MTDRIPLDDMTDDQLDALYERLEAVEATESQRQLATARKALASATVRAARAEDAMRHVMDLDVPDVAAALHPAYALGWKDALALARGVLDPAQRPLAATGSGAAAPSPPGGDAPSRAHSGP